MSTFWENPNSIGHRLVGAGQHLRGIDRLGPHPVQRLVVCAQLVAMLLVDAADSTVELLRFGEIAENSRRRICAGECLGRVSRRPRGTR
nr:hypothetical protein [Candidatus Mycobacterium methanotrophicum]